MTKKKLKRFKVPTLTPYEREQNRIFNNERAKLRRKAKGLVQVTFWVPENCRKTIKSRTETLIKEMDLMGATDETYEQKLKERDIIEDHGDYEIHYVDDEGIEDE